MKIADAWTSVLNQNATLREILGCLALALIVLTISTVRLAYKEPLIIERGYQHNVLTAASSEYTEAEVKKAIESGLKQRFNSKSGLGVQFLNQELSAIRDREQKQLSDRKLEQFINVLDIDAKGKSANVGVIRVIKAGLIPSAFLMKLEVDLEAIPRSVSNPIGLRLSNVKEITKDSKDE